MADKSGKELKVRDKQEMTSPAEYTTPGPLFTPSVDIFETEREIMLLADMPGVSADDLTIDLRDDMLTLTGKIDPPDISNEEAIITEYETGSYYRQFTLSEIIDQNKIDAKSGILVGCPLRYLKKGVRKNPIDLLICTNDGLTKKTNFKGKKALLRGKIVTTKEKVKNKK